MDDWVEPGPLAPDHRYHRVVVIGAELRDYGRDVCFLLQDAYGDDYWCPAMNREEAQKLMDAMWKYGLRPNG